MAMLSRVLALALLLLTASPATAEETIRAFGTTIFVKQDGSLDVVERIAVDVENVAIRHGIFRDFPTRYTTPNGGRMKVGFTFVEAKLDSGPVESKVETRSNGVRIKLGSADSIVPPGLHLYQIHYRVTRELGYFRDYDELYWNVTGNGWDFPIARAGVQVHLPQKVRFGQRAFYTGYQGSTASEAQVTEEAPGLITIVATRPLLPKEGLTVAVAFPKGVVDAPSSGQELGWWLSDMLSMVIAFLSLAAVIGFLVYAWKNAGRDPPEGTVVPLFAPPDDLSPAEMRYVVEQGFDDRAFAAALVDAGVKGHLIIGEDKGFLFFGGEKYIRGAATPGTPLPAAEQAAIAALVAPGERLELDNENHATFSAAKSSLEKAFKAPARREIFPAQLHLGHRGPGCVVGRRLRDRAQPGADRGRLPEPAGTGPAGPRDRRSDRLSLGPTQRCCILCKDGGRRRARHRRDLPCVHDGRPGGTIAALAAAGRRRARPSDRSFRLFLD